MSSKLPRRQLRQKRLPVMRLTERDYAILQAVYDYRVMTTSHIQALFFASQHKTYARLNKLFQHGFLDRRVVGVGFAQMNTPLLYVLDRRGADLLHSRGLTINWHRKQKQVTAFFLQHTLALTTLRVAMTVACRQHQFELVTWLGENDLKAHYDRVTLAPHAQPVAVIPDSYCAIRTSQGVQHFFWELDRGTMTTKRFQGKVRAYLAYARSGELFQRFGIRRFRVLTVTESYRRTANLKQVTEEGGGKSRFWFATLVELTPHTILQSPVWGIAGRPAPTSLLSHEKRVA